MKQGWISSNLEKITSKIGSGATPSGGGESYKDEGISLVRSLNVYDDGFREEKLARIDDDQADKLSNVTVQSGDVLFNITGASVARCCVVPNSVLPARVNQHVSILRPIDTVISSEFLHYLLISPDTKQALLNVGEEGGSTRQAITKAQLQGFRIVYPPLPEQKRIVSILDEAFEGIATAKANAEQNFKNARALYECQLDTAFYQNTDNWSEREFSEVCEISSMLVDPRKAEFLDLIHVGGANIESKTGTFLELKTAREEALISGKFIFDDSMVLYSKIRPYLMKVARPCFSGLCSADIYPLSVKPGQIDRNYLFHLLLSPTFTEYANLGSARAGMPKVNRTHLFAYRCRYPSIETQIQIAASLDNILEDTRRLETIYRQKIAALDELKKSLLHQAFSGTL